MAAERSRFVVWRGRDEPPPEPIILRAGPVTALLDGPDLRRVRLGDVELAQRVYPAVRDEVWNTIPLELTNFEIDRTPDGFRVDFDVRHCFADIAFFWHGCITGDKSGTISYSFEGESRSSFRYAKIGLNVHHPLRECVGRPFRAQTPAGEIRGELPSEIVPQRSENGRLTALFPEYDELTISLPQDVNVTFHFEGDLFEMQDHRNWTDANFKSYGTPMSVPWPFDAQPGEKVHQTITISFAAPVVPSAAHDGVVTIELAADPLVPMPAVGLAAAGHDQPLTARQSALLRTLRPDHVRVDLVLSDRGYAKRLEHGLHHANAIGVPLELAVFLGAGDGARLDELASLLRGRKARLVRVLVFAGGTGFSSTSGSTPGDLVALARTRLESLGAPFFGGTNQFFAELNRDRPEVAPLDGVAFSINPQVHAADDTSIVENLAAQADTVRMARTFVGKLPIAITPITFVGRGGPFPAGPPSSSGLPGQVDARQASLLGAAWTVGSMKYLAESGVTSTTWFETSGWLGVMETELGPQRPDLFPSRPNDVFPLYHVLADVGEWKDGTVVPSASSHPLRVDVLAVRDESGTHLLVANMTPSLQRVRVAGLAENVRIRTLDDTSAADAIERPELFRNRGEPLSSTAESFEVEMKPFAVIRVDALHAA